MRKFAFAILFQNITPCKVHASVQSLRCLFLCLTSFRFVLFFHNNNPISTCHRKKWWQALMRSMCIRKGCYFPSEKITKVRQIASGNLYWFQLIIAKQWTAQHWKDFIFVLTDRWLLQPNDKMWGGDLAALQRSSCHSNLISPRQTGHCLLNKEVTDHST